jgi:type I restriction enzyme S subunit
MNITNSDFMKMPIPLPPLKEQQKIAEILITWDKAISKQEELIKAKEKLKKGLMQKLLSGEVRFKEFHEEWEEVRLGDIGYTYGGLNNKTAEDFGCGNAQYITYKNIFDNDKIDILIFDNVKINNNEKQNRVMYGDILFTTSSETPEEVGMSSVLLDEIDELYLNSFCFGYRLNDLNILSPQFARFYFRSFHMRDKISRLAQGSTRFNLSKLQVMKIKIKLPSLPEQQKIAQVLSIADKEIELLKQKLEELKKQKKGLMQRLLTGEVRVKV